MVFHDETINAKTSGEGAVSQLTIAELKDVSINVDPPEHILTLEEAFQAFRHRNEKWILDIKSKRIHQQVLEWLSQKIKAGKLSNDQVILFGTYDVLTDYRNAGYSLGYTAIWGNSTNRLRVLFRQSEILDRCRDLGCDYLILPEIFANKSLIENAKSDGLNVWVYGVDDKRDFNFLANRGITGFIVDHPKQFANGGGNLAQSEK